MERGHEDWDLWLTLLERGGRGTIIPEILFYYRRRLDSRSAIADRGATYLELFRDRIRKHAPSYRAHSFELSWDKDQDCYGKLVWLNGLDREVTALDARAAYGREAVAELRRALMKETEQLVERKPAPPVMTSASPVELEVLRRELDAYGPRRDRLHGEVEAFRKSVSWAMTKPLRLLFERVRPRLRRG